MPDFGPRPRSNSPLLDPRRIKHGQHVERHVARVAELAQDLQVLEDLVAAVAVLGRSVVELARGFEVLDELADTHDLARQAELYFSVKEECVSAGNGGRVSGVGEVWREGATHIAVKGAIIEGGLLVRYRYQA